MLLLGFLVGLILGMGAMSLGFMAGVSVEKSRKPELLEPPNPNKCGCQHHRSYHRKDGQCYYDAEVWDTDECEFDCTCQHFWPERPEDPFLEAAKKELGS